MVDLKSAGLPEHQPRNPDKGDAIRIGLVGCGRVAEFGYLPAFRIATGVELAGVADIDQTRCKTIAPGVPAYETSRDLINAGGLNALIISTPTRFHLEGARCAAEAGLPALVEKPPGLNVEEAAALKALNSPLWIGFNRRFEPGIARLKNDLPGDREVHLQLELHYRRAAWKPFDMHDDALLDLGPHLIDLARWLTESEILWARARSLKTHRAEFELGLERGHAVISCSSNSPYRERVELKNLAGRVESCYRRGGLISGILAKLQPLQENPLVIPMASQLEALSRAVRRISQRTALATPADGLVAMSALAAIRRSAINGGASLPVSLTEPA